MSVLSRIGKEKQLCSYRKEIDNFKTNYMYKIIVDQSAE